MNKISTIIVVKNKPKHLFESLESIQNFSNEIIIGAIQLNENYREKIQQFKNIKIVELPQNISYADLVKEDLQKKASGDFILYLDPDEIFPKEVIKDILKRINNYDYFLFPRKNIIFGKWISHSRWWPDYQLRLFKKNHVFWPKRLHPIPQTKGKEYKFSSQEQFAITHYNYDNLDQFLEKAVRYAKSEAKSLVKEGKDYSLNKAIGQAITEFISRFFAGEGYKDGMHGFSLAILQMFYYFLVYFYYWEEKKYFKTDQKETVNQSNFFITKLFKESNYWMIKKTLINSWKRIKLKALDKFIND